MAWTIIWTQSAWDDLEAAADYISKDSPGYAASFVREVRDAARSLNTLMRPASLENWCAPCLMSFLTVTPSSKH